MSLRPRPWAWLLSGVLVALPAIAQADETLAEHAQAQKGEDLLEYVPGAARLEGRIIAPCCWNQTIDIHGSEPAYELRREIRRRLKAGESSDTIEASLVSRYGKKILAVPDSSPLGGLATVLSLAFGGAGIAGYFMLKRWSRAGKPTASKPKAQKDAPVSPEKDGLDARLDQELSEIRDLP
jgi:cytochrome c-type biogenesis protein CcmH